jgi:hypothetical protein
MNLRLPIVEFNYILERKYINLLVEIGEVNL